MHNHLLGFSLRLEYPSTQLLALNTTLRKITEAKEKNKMLITNDYSNILYWWSSSKKEMDLPRPQSVINNVLMWMFLNISSIVRHARCI
jgi:hypothetical protein